MQHEECVNLIKRAGDTLALKVVTANTSYHFQNQDLHNISSQSLPYRRKGLDIDFLLKSKLLCFIFFSSTSTRS